MLPEKHAEMKLAGKTPTFIVRRTNSFHEPIMVFVPTDHNMDTSTSHKFETAFWHKGCSCCSSLHLNLQPFSAYSSSVSYRWINSKKWLTINLSETSWCFEAFELTESSSRVWKFVPQETHQKQTCLGWNLIPLEGLGLQNLDSQFQFALLEPSMPSIAIPPDIFRSNLSLEKIKLLDLKV